MIIGAGGHGLATAYHLAKDYGHRSIAVIEKARSASAISGAHHHHRSNYSTPENIRFYEASLKLWEGLERELNFNVMISQRGTLTSCIARRRRTSSRNRPI